MTMLFATAFMAAGLAMPGAAVAQSIYGAQVQPSYVFPDLNTTHCTGTTMTAGPGVEFPLSCVGYFQADITPTQIVITLSGGVSFTSTAHNGPRFFFIGAGDLSGSTVAPGSATIQGLTTTNNSITINWAGRSFVTGDVVTINLSAGLAGPTVTALSPTSGSAAGGTIVTLTGTGFTGATAVSFGATAASAFTVNSATSITATAPAGTGTVDVTVTTAAGTSATAGSGNDYTYTGVSGIGPASLSDASVASTYSETLSANDCVGPCTFAVTAGALPTGLTLSSAGVLSGTPTAGGAFNFTVTATDAGAGGLTANRAYSLTVDAPTIALSPAALPAATTAVAYSESISAAGGVAPYSYALTAGALPAGMTLSSTGVLSGTPTAGGSFNFTVTATDSATGAGPYTGSQAYSLTVGAPTIALSPAALPAATTAVAYSETITASGGVGTYSYALTAGALPAGMTLSSSGVLSGTPTAGGSFNFTVTATDQSTGAGPYTGSRAYSLTVGAP
ncbi:MAG: IPT/TIG domain-containing protein, partial [Brevundimonas sp.]|uniref:IPT/TIG domain-containing protein n=1 Tax=Brevundimonas sp. TaxID=1871086 RepID=UPI0027354E38